MRRPLRVVHLDTSRYFHGVERYISSVTQALSRRGVEVVVIGGKPTEMHAALVGTGVEYHPASNPASALRQLLAQRRADVVHAHMTAAELSAALAKPLLRSRLVVTRHFAQPRGSKPGARTVGRLAARSIDCQIAVSRFVADHIEGESEVLLSGTPECEPGPHDEPVVLVAQRMESEKAGSLAIEAWARSGMAIEGWRLTVAGDGKERSNLESLATSLGVRQSVVFLGFVREIDRLMARASILLAPVPAEPFGLSVVEAMACALPVVAAAGGGHLETVGRAFPASLFPPGDADAAAAALRRFAHDASLRRECGEQERSFQRRELSVERHVDRLLEIYDTVVAGSPGNYRGASLSNDSRSDLVGGTPDA